MLHQRRTTTAAALVLTLSSALSGLAFGQQSRDVLTTARATGTNGPQPGAAELKAKLTRLAEGLIAGETYERLGTSPSEMSDDFHQLQVITGRTTLERVLKSGSVDGQDAAAVSSALANGVTFSEMGVSNWSECRRELMIRIGKDFLSKRAAGQKPPAGEDFIALALLLGVTHKDLGCTPAELQQNGLKTASERALEELRWHRGPHDPSEGEISLGAERRTRWNGIVTAMAWGISPERLGTSLEELRTLQHSFRVDAARTALAQDDPRYILDLPLTFSVLRQVQVGWISFGELGTSATEFNKRIYQRIQGGARYQLARAAKNGGDSSTVASIRLALAFGQTPEQLGTTPDAIDALVRSSRIAAIKSAWAEVIPGQTVLGLNSAIGEALLSGIALEELGITRQELSRRYARESTLPEATAALTRLRAGKMLDEGGNCVSPPIVAAYGSGFGLEEIGVSEADLRQLLRQEAQQRLEYLRGKVVPSTGSWPNVSSYGATFELEGTLYRIENLGLSSDELGLSTAKLSALRSAARTKDARVALGRMRKDDWNDPNDQARDKVVGDTVGLRLDDGLVFPEIAPVWDALAFNVSLSELGTTSAELAALVEKKRARTLLAEIEYLMKNPSGDRDSIEQLLYRARLEGIDVGRPPAEYPNLITGYLTQRVKSVFEVGAQQPEDPRGVGKLLHVISEPLLWGVPLQGLPIDQKVLRERCLRPFRSIAAKLKGKEGQLGDLTDRNCDELGGARFIFDDAELGLNPRDLGAAQRDILVNWLGAEIRRDRERMLRIHREKIVDALMRGATPEQLGLR